MNVVELLNYTFFQNALWGSLLASIACGIIGSYVVARRMVFISGGITHASFGGIGIGFFFGWDPILSALGFSVLTALGIQWTSKNQNVREDSAIGVFWSLGMALGIIFIFLTPGYAPNLSEYLFGNILTISQTDILHLAILSTVLVLFFTFFYRSILSVSFDKEFAKTRGVPVAFFEYLLIILVAITIVLSIRLVGIVLLISLLTVPQMTANIFTNHFFKIMVLSVIISFAGCVIGLLLSYTLNVPSGAFIIFVLIAIYLISKFGAYLYRVKRNK